MKSCHLMLLALMLALSACGNATTPSTDQIISGIYTAGALTLDAQAQISASSSTPLPVSTAMATPAPTLMPLAAMQTLIPPTNAPLQNHPSGLWQNSGVPIQVDHNICNSSAYINDVTIPDGTILTPGETFVKTWTLQNTGFCMWKANYMLTFFEGDTMSGMDTEIGKAIASGSQAKVSIALTAPNSEGTYTGYWILADGYGYPFGTPFFVQIVVSNQ